MATLNAESKTEIRSTLSGPYYWDRDIYELEKERIFYDSWLGVGRADQIPKSGDFFVRQVADESVVILRGETHEINSFYNVCRHRGNQICAQESGRFKGGAIACRYHGWTYALNGSLVATPNMVDVPGFRREDFPLYPVAVHLWEGFIFLNFSPDPEPFDPDLGQVADKLARYNLSGLKAAHREVFRVKANWKILEENNLECYHCPGIHPELCAIQPAVGKGMIGSENADGNPLIEGGNTFSLTAKTSRPLISSITKDDMSLFRSTTIYPNFFLGLLPDHVFTFAPWPLGPGETSVVVEWLFEPATIKATGFDPSDTVSFLNMVLRQDFDLCEEVQKGIQSRAHHSGVYSPQEHLPYKFNQWILERLEGSR